jgi:hypothetical protein
MMSLAIAHHIREQVVFPNDVIYQRQKQEFSLEKKYEVSYDWGEDIPII